MFRVIISPIFRCARLCVTASSWVHYTTSCNTQSSAPEDGLNNRPKHVELTGIINKPLLFHLVGCLYYLYQSCTVKQISNEFHSCLVEVPFLRGCDTVSLYCTETLGSHCPIPGEQLPHMNCIREIPSSNPDLFV